MSDVEKIPQNEEQRKIRSEIVALEAERDRLRRVIVMRGGVGGGRTKYLTRFQQESLERTHTQLEDCCAKIDVKWKQWREARSH